MIRKPGDLPDLAEQSLFAIGSVSGSGWVSNENPRSIRCNPCRVMATGIFLLGSASSRVPHLRSERRKSRAGRWSVRRRAGWLRAVSEFSNTPVLLKLGLGSAVLAVAGMVLVIVAAAVGPFTIPPSLTIGILLEHLGLAETTASDAERAIITTIRLPRILLALVVGAALGVSGAVMQGLSIRCRSRINAIRSGGSAARDHAVPHAVSLCSAPNGIRRAGARSHR